MKMKNKIPEIRSSYHYKSGQNEQNTKMLRRSKELVIPSSTLDRLLSYAKENERISLLAEKETKRLAALKEATYNMSKSWDDTTQNIRKRREDEFLSRKEDEEKERIKLAKELAEKCILERDEVVKEAKELLLYRRPNVRLLNRALLQSECFRELDEQVKFQNTIKELYEKYNEENVRFVQEDVKKFHIEENKKREKIRENARKNSEELKKQIKENEINSKKSQEFMKACEIEDLKNIAKEIDDIKTSEIQEKLKKKAEFKQMCLDGIKDKKKYDLKVEQHKEIQEKSIKIFTDFKRETDFLIKKKEKEEMQEKVKQNEILGKRLHKMNELERLAWEEKEKKKLEAEEERQKVKELKNIEEKKQKRLKAHLGLKEHIKNLDDEHKKRKKEEMDLKLWENLQRIKRDEFNKEFELQQKQKEKEKQLHYGKILKQQMIEKIAENKKAAKENDYSAEMKAMIEKANEKVLSYGEEVIKESEGVRPLYPIVKVLTQFKRDIGLIPPYRKEADTEEPAETLKKKGGRRTICTKPIDDDKILYLS